MKIILPKTLFEFLHKSLLNYNICNKLLINFNLMKLKTLIIAILLISSCVDKNKKTEEVSENIKEKEVVTNKTPENFELEVYDFAGFESFLNKKDDKIHVINFWATWCAPCIKELPYFEKINETYKEKDVEVVLVSLDFPHLYEKKLKPFIKTKNLKSKVIALDDTDMNSWISKVNQKWTGSIPATVIYKNDERKFFEQSFTYDELEREVNKFLK